MLPVTVLPWASSLTHCSPFHCTLSCARSVPSHRDIWFVPSVCSTSMNTEVVAWSFLMETYLTLRCVDAPGEPTIVVVVAVVIGVFVRPGVIVPLALSTQEQ